MYDNFDIFERTLPMPERPILGANNNEGNDETISLNFYY